MRSYQLKPGDIVMLRNGKMGKLVNCLNYLPFDQRWLQVFGSPSWETIVNYNTWDIVSCRNNDDGNFYDVVHTGKEIEKRRQMEGRNRNRHSK